MLSCSLWPLLALTIAIAACERRDVERRHPAPPATAAPSIAPSITVSIEGRYRVAYPPGAHLLEQRPIELATNEGPLLLRVVGANAGDAGYAVEWTDYPPYFVAEETPEAILRHAMDHCSARGRRTSRPPR